MQNQFLNKILLDLLD